MLKQDTNASKIKSILVLKRNEQGTMIRVEFYLGNIVRIINYPEGKVPSKKSYSVIMQPRSVDLKLTQNEGSVSTILPKLKVMLDERTGKVFFSDNGNKELLNEKGNVCLNHVKVPMMQENIR